MYIYHALVCVCVCVCKARCAQPRGCRNDRCYNLLVKVVLPLSSLPLLKAARWGVCWVGGGGGWMAEWLKKRSTPSVRKVRARYKPIVVISIFVPPAQSRGHEACVWRPSCRSPLSLLPCWHQRYRPLMLTELPVRTHFSHRACVPAFRWIAVFSYTTQPFVCVWTLRWIAVFSYTAQAFACVRAFW